MPANQGKGTGRFGIAALLTAVAAFVPFVRLFLGGESLYFRDLSGQFFPARRFILDGLASGEWRFWNPFLHEGVPVALPPYAYLPDLLQGLIPNEFGISLFLALHVPFAALSFMLLARRLELSPVAAAAGAAVYALGGFTLSTINLYVYVQTIAWAPLFILAFREAVDSGRARALVLAALALAMMISTTGLEIAFQACLIAVLVSPPSSRARFLRSAASALLGLGLVAAIVVPLLGVAGQSERAVGFPTSVVLANSIHPMTLVQVLIASFYGDVSNLTGTWWGVNFFPRGFPYVLSLYLGPCVVALALGGAASNRPLRKRLIALVVTAAFVSLGRYAGLETLVDLSPAFRFLRFPVKAFFAVQFSVAVLAAFGVAEIEAFSHRVVKRISLAAMGLGGILVGLLLIPSLAPSATAWFLKGFLPAGLAAEKQALIARFVTHDAATSGLVALALSALTFLTSRGRLIPARCAMAVVGLVAADLIRAGAGLNASVTNSFYQLSPEMTHEVSLIRQSGGRLFTCNPEASPTYWQGRRARGGNHEAFTMACLQEALTPDFNVSFRVRTALSIDRTGLVPTSRILTPELATCSEFSRIVEPLRSAGVNRVVSFEPLNDPSLRLLSEVTPSRIAPVTIRIYELTGALARFSLPVDVVSDLPNHLSLDVNAEGPAELIVRDPWGAGWHATVNGVDRPIGRTPDDRRAIGLDAGRNQVRMSYEPPGFRSGMIITLVTTLACLALCLIPGRTPRLEVT